MTKQKEHPHHKMYEKHAKGGMIHHLGEGHWEKKVEETEVADGRYASEMGAAQELKADVDGLANYVKSHRAKH